VLITLVKTPGGVIPSSPRDAARLLKVGDGEALECEYVSASHSGMFHRKTMALFQTAFEFFQEHCPPLEWRGVPVNPSFDRFRKDLTILAGHYKPVYKIDGSVILVARSLAYKNCTDEEKARVYNDVLDAALEHVYKHCLDKAELGRIVEQLVAFG
jgi:hypothetical protein